MSQKSFDLLSYLKWFTLFIAVSVMLVTFNYMVTTAWTTDLYGRPVTLLSDFQRALTEHPEWLWKLPWGKEFSGLYLWEFYCAGFIAYVVQHTSWWRKRGFADIVDVPFEYLIVVVPLLILAMGITSVGGHRTYGFGFEMKIPIKGTPGNFTIYQAFRDGNVTNWLLEIPNYLYANSSHFCTEFSMGAVTLPLAVENLFGKRKDGTPRAGPFFKIVLVLILITTLAAHWEHIENLGQLASGGPLIGSYNPPDESLANMVFDTLGLISAIALFAVTNMIGDIDWYADLPVLKTLKSW
jgi:uncharacterized membrane protein YjdF